LVTTRSDAEEVDNWDLVLHRLAEPPIIGGIGVLTHESVINCFFSLKNLAVNVSLIVVPNATARLWKHGFD